MSKLHFLKSLHRLIHKRLDVQHRLQLLHTLHRDLHDLRSSDGLAVCRAEAQQLLLYHAAQSLFDSLGREIAHPARKSRADISHDDRCGRGRKGQRYLPGVGRPVEQGGQQPCDAYHHHDICRERQPLKGHVPRNVLLALADRAAY